MWIYGGIQWVGWVSGVVLDSWLKVLRFVLVGKRSLCVKPLSSSLLTALSDLALLLIFCRCVLYKHTFFRVYFKLSLVSLVLLFALGWFHEVTHVYRLSRVCVYVGESLYLRKGHSFLVASAHGYDVTFAQ